jgi:nitroimidazol reductase NimA-like FMN-containing flavoprotein (pyridoxamine 5'-phosphate oxidase superfamily)
MYMDDKELEMEYARKDALAFLKRHKTGVLATVSADYQPQSSLVYYTADDDFNIYFLTLVSTRKYAALSAHSEVAFTVATEGVPQTLQIEGRAMDISLDEVAAKKRDELFEVLNSNPWFYPPVSKLDPSESAVIWVRPTWIRWADYAFAASDSGKVFKEIPIK